MEDEKLSLIQVELQVTQPDSLRFVQLLWDHLVEMRGRAGCHKHSNVKRNHLPV